MTPAFDHPDSPPRKVKRRLLRCHGCGRRAVYYFVRRSRCLCGNCKKAYDPLAVAANNRMTLQELARRIETKGCE